MPTLMAVGTQLYIHGRPRNLLLLPRSQHLSRSYNNSISIIVMGMNYLLIFNQSLVFV